MAFPASAWFPKTMGDALSNGIALNMDTDTIKVALFTDALTSPTMHTDNGAIGGSPWTSNEVTGAGYTAGGATLANPTVTVSAGKLVFTDSPATTTWSGATITNARGALIHDTTVSRGICVVNFGAEYSTVSGTFTITWDATNGIAYAIF